MPKVLSHTPSWLSRPAPGFNVFQPTDKVKTGSLSNGYGKKVEHRGPIRTLAHRKTEIFFVVDNEIRWSDLILLKDAGDSEETQKCSRVLKAPVAGQIRQLVISPQGDYLAIVTSHTVHVAILPTRLDTTDPSAGPVRLKTFQLGPTAHVLEQAPLASVIWHPLGALGSCLVTVASDACVRLWELNRDSRHSFDEPALALDMKKLANAASYGEDMRASVYGTSKGFSPDQVEMEVAAACFGGIGTSDESGWAPMTLWVAMTEGDVYALCPLLPSKWQPAVSTIPSLTTSVVSKAAILEQTQGLPEEERRRAKSQQEWLADIDAQEPLLELLQTGLETVEVYQRPTHPPAIPKLQGPLRLNPEPDLGEISDIIAIAPKLDDDGLDEEEDEYGEPVPRPGSSIGLIVLLTKPGTAHICLDTTGVEAHWLPKRRSTFQPSPPSDDALNLLVLESLHLEVTEAPGSSWPAFTMNLPNRYLAGEPLYEQDPVGRYGFCVYTASGVFACDLTSWLSNLEDELFGPIDTGSSFRIGLLYESERSLVNQVVKLPSSSSSTAAISLLDSDLGHFILTLASHQPYSATLELPISFDMLDSFAPDSAPLLLPTPESREAYIPPRDFFTQTQLPCLIDQTLYSGASRLKRQDLNSQVRLSPATLQILTEAHRILSDETNKLGLAAADLFRRCQRMQAELAEQVRKVRELHERAEYVTGTEEGRTKQEKIDERVTKIRERDATLQGRVDGLRRKVAGLSGKELSKREEAWKSEVAELEGSIDGDAGQSLSRRLEAVKRLKGELVSKAKEAREAEERQTKAERRSSTVPSELRRKKLDQVMALLERESALVDAVSQRLERLSVMGGR